MTFLGRNWSPRGLSSLEADNPPYLDVINVLILEPAPLLLHDKGDACYGIVSTNRKVFLTFSFKCCLKQA